MKKNNTTDQHDGVDDGEGEHIARDHAVNHRDKRTRQPDGPESIKMDIKFRKNKGKNNNYPAKNMRKNQADGTARIRIASSVSRSPVNRHGMHDSVKRFDMRKIALAGLCDF